MPNPILEARIDRVQFDCQQCRKCCIDQKVYLTEEDLRRITENVGLKEVNFVDHFGSGKYIKRPNGRCIFLEFNDDGKTRCKVYPYCPKACRRWPLLALSEDMEISLFATLDCPGIGKGKEKDLEEFGLSP